MIFLFFVFCCFLLAYDLGGNFFFQVLITSCYCSFIVPLFGLPSRL